jgi:putative lipoic acid-binding regulatory protein
MTDDKDTLLEFPCDFPIKVMGHATDEFETLVLSIITKHVETLKENAIRTRHSKDGKYLSITITINVNCKEQLDNIYLELTESEHILFVL